LSIFELSNILSEVALLAPTYEYGYVGFVCGFVFHSDSIITRGLGGWKGDVGFGTICFMYVSCMFQFFSFLGGIFVGIVDFFCLNHRRHRGRWGTL